MWAVLEVLTDYKKKVKKGNVRKWLSYQNAYTLHKKNTKKFPRRKTLVGGIDNQWESDLMVISSISKANLGYNYILLCIDVLSKFGWAVAIRDKSGKCVAAALKHIIIFKENADSSFQYRKR